jgi:hypothetical protein
MRVVMKRLDDCAVAPWEMLNSALCEPACGRLETLCGELAHALLAPALEFRGALARDRVDGRRQSHR